MAASSLQFLNSILTVMPAVQARQLSEILQKLQVSGTVRNASEYSAKLSELAALINDTIPVPSMSQIRSLVWDLCSSDAHNIMMDAAKNDIEAAFLQVGEIGNKLNDHHILFMENLIADLERGLKKQENEIRRLEWLADYNNEFTDVLVNNFNSSSLLQVSRSDSEASTLYFDNRTYQSRTANELPSAIVSEHGSKLILDIEQDPLIRPVSVKIHSDDNSHSTDINVDYESDLNNIIDGKNGTYWTNNVYLQNKVEKVTTILEFSFGLAKDVSYVIIEGATKEPFFVELIQGLLPSGERVDLSTSSHEVNGSIRIDFLRSNLTSVLITFAVYTFRREEYYVSEDLSILTALDSTNKYNLQTLSNSLSPALRRIITSNQALSICNIPQLVNNQICSCVYSLSLDNVWFGNAVYTDAGLFVSKPLSVTNPGIIAVRANESSDTSNSIEYEIIKIDRTPKYKETKFPIPKLGQSSVTKERLILTKTSVNSTINNIGALRFLPYIPVDFEVGDTEPISIYRNNSQISLDSGDWMFAISEASLGDISSLEWKSSFVGLSFDDYTITPAKLWIKITEPILNAVYACSYNIRTSDTISSDETKTVWLDKEKIIALLDNGKVQVVSDPDMSIDSDLFLQITLRRNSSSQSKTPELYEYALLASKYE